MRILNYETLKAQGYQGYLLPHAPERVLQFGEGNFLRGFVDYFFDMANEKSGFNGKVLLVQPIDGGLSALINAQAGLYTLYLRGLEKGAMVNERRIISSVSRCINPYAAYEALLTAAANPDLRYIVSNTTEAGIAWNDTCRYHDAPPESFPAKLCRFLHERWKVLSGGKGTGMVILSCELIDDNGKLLEKYVYRHAKQWGLETEFSRWLEDECLFCSTLVDRIVTGYPRAEADALNAENGYIDNCYDVGEVFGLWIIEGPAWLENELPFMRAGLPVKVVADHAPYKKQKVRLLNGAHTTIVPAAFLCGQNIVRDSMHDADMARFFRRAVWEEIIPAVPLPRKELEAFAIAVEERFKNPFLDHQLLSIALNTTSKWRTRVLPSLKDGLKQTGGVPKCLAFGLAAVIVFFSTAHIGAEGTVCGTRNGKDYPLREDAAVVNFYLTNGAKPSVELTKLVLSRTDFWGEDLTALPELEVFVAETLEDIRKNGMRAALRRVLTA